MPFTKSTPTDIGLTNGFQEIKKPESYSEAYGAAVGRALYPSEQHANIIALAKECGQTISLTGNIAFSSPIDQNIFIHAVNSSAASVDVTSGATKPGFKIIIMSTASTVTFIPVAGTSITLDKGISEFMWDGSAWRMVTSNTPVFKQYTTPTGNFAVGDLSIGGITHTTSAATGLGLSCNAAKTAVTLRATDANVSNVLTVGSNITLTASTGYITATKVANAIWNDIVDFLPLDEEVELEAGKVYCFDNGKFVKTSKRCQLGTVGLISDTYGFAVGKKDIKNEAPVAIGGYVLAHTDYVYASGTPLTATKDGMLTRMSFIEKILFPERMVATFLREEKQSSWNGVVVKGRNWVKVI